MRKGLVGSSLLTVALALSACSPGGKNSDQGGSGITLEQVQWSDGTARQLREAIEKRAAHGLDRKQFAIDSGSGSTLDQAKLNEQALAYAAALARGASDPGKLFKIYSVPRSQTELRPGLAKALRDGKIGEWLESLAPQDESYRKLSEAYLGLRKQGDAAPAAIPQVREPLKPGVTDPRIPAIAGQLAAFDYLEKGAAQGNRYTPPMARAVQRMQADYGIKPDGVIGSDALEILNLSDADRARAIAVNMERMRWLAREAPATRIDVNLAVARLTYWRDGKIADTRKVIVGEPDTETPQLGSPIFRLVANPTWTVPASIASKEIAGKGAGYLQRNNMAWKNGKIVQQPGPKNSLGLVKFDMENPHSIYLHDTPVKQLFAEVQRQRSHGCVRVEDALGFAEILARDEGVLDQWHQARATGKETFVALPKLIPVRLLYQTAVFNPDGELVLRSDPYGWNDRIADALGFKIGAERKVKNGADDFGP